MTGVAQTYPQLAGVGELSMAKSLGTLDSDEVYYLCPVNYAACVVLEVRAPTSGGNDPTIRMVFKNGTDDVFNTYNMFGESGDIPLSEFKARLLVRFALASLRHANTLHL